VTQRRGPAATETGAPDVVVTPAAALAALQAAADPEKAAAMATYHKAPRVYLGLAVPQIEALVAEWRHADVPARVALAAGLWDSDVHEARLAAAKLLTQARIRDGEPLVWAETLRWVPGFDAWALADHACKAIDRRLVADPARLDIVETWTVDPSKWVRRGALVATLPWSRQRYPTPEERAARERILGWAARYVSDRDWFIQKAIGWWLRSLSVPDPERVRAFLAGPGQALAPFARREALRRLRAGSERSASRRSDPLAAF
jgi:3-methyladenine DNA glycosylase AlkD